MKFSLHLILMFFIGVSTAQNGIIDIQLENDFNSFSKTIINENIKAELDLTHQSLFLYTSKDSIIIQCQVDKSKKNTTQIKFKNKLIVTKKISKPTIKKNIEFRIIDYIIVKELTFNKNKFDFKKISNSSKNIDFITTKRVLSQRMISFNREKGIGLYEYHKKVLVVRNLNSNEWFFISKKWWDFSKTHKTKNRTTWKNLTNYTKKHYSTLPFIIPKKLLKQLKHSSSYYDLYN